MENKKYAPIYDKLLPVYKLVATPTWRGNKDNDRVDVTYHGPGEERWERNAVGYEGVLVLDEYRRNGRDFEPKFDYRLEDKGINCNHSDTSFLMVLCSARNKFAEVTGMTFREWLKANGEPVDHLFEDSPTEKKVARAYRDDTPEEKAAQKIRFENAAKGPVMTKQPDLMDQDLAPQHKATRQSSGKLEAKYQAALAASGKSVAPPPSKTAEKLAKKETPNKPNSAADEHIKHPAEQLSLLV